MGRKQIIKPRWGRARADCALEPVNKSHLISIITSSITQNVSHALVCTPPLYIQDGRTALIEAALQGHFELAELLLKHGANKSHQYEVRHIRASGGRVHLIHEPVADCIGPYYSIFKSLRSDFTRWTHPFARRTVARRLSWVLRMDSQKLWNFWSKKAQTWTI